MDIFFLIISSLLVGLVIGLLSGLLGIGGGTIMVPAFKLIFGLPAIASTATSLFTVIPTSISGAFVHIRKKTCIPLLGIAAGLGGACTSPLGVWLASLSPEWAIMTAAALVIAYSAITMFAKAMKMRGKSVSADAKAQGEASLDSLRDIPARKLIPLGALIGAAAGVMSGYVGVGGGFLMVPLFMQLLKTPMKLTSGTSLIAIIIIAIPGTITNAVMGNIDWIAGIFVALGAIPGAAIGSRLISRIPEFQLRLLFSGFLIVAAALLVINEMGIL